MEEPVKPDSETLLEAVEALLAAMETEAASSDEMAAAPAAADKTATAPAAAAPSAEDEPTESFSLVEAFVPATESAEAFAPESMAVYTARYSDWISPEDWLTFDSWQCGQTQVFPTEGWVNSMLHALQPRPRDGPQDGPRDGPQDGPRDESTEEDKALVASLLTPSQRETIAKKLPGKGKIFGGSNPDTNPQAYLINYRLLNAVSDSSYSCIVGYQVAPMVALCMKVFQRFKKPSLSIIDATSNVGASTLVMMAALERARLSVGSEVTAVEINTITAIVLRRNLDTARRSIRGGYSGSRPAVVADSCVRYLDSDVRADFISFDPPWGGPDYYKAANLPLFLDEQPLGTIAGKALARNAPVVMSKLAPNTPLAEYEDQVKAFVPGAIFETYHLLKPKGAIAYVISVAWRC